MFTGAQVALVLFDLSWIRDLVAEDALQVLAGGGERAGVAGLVYGAGKIWVLILLVDVLWTGARAAAAVRRG